VLRLAADQWTELARSPVLAAEVAEGAGSLVIVDVDGALVPTAPILAPYVAVAVLHGPPLADPSPFDVLVSGDDTAGLQAVCESVSHHPQAALVAAQVMRANASLDVASALAVESAAYSMLQAGPEFAAWLAGRPPPRPRPVDADPVIVERAGEELLITLNRPGVHNAFDRRMRDALTEALRLAAEDTALARVRLRGAGPSFCSGGDLDEFGTGPDPAGAHVVRTTRSAAWAAWQVAAKLRVELHGAAIGAGIELAAWAAEITATEDTVMQLPEVGLGLIPGAGGTASLPPRIGRHRAVALAITGRRLDAPTALRWGLIDRISESTRRR
jgi:enoyl-CoA hydratase/carnithine racemase